MLKQSRDELWHDYDLAILDLDGVVYIGPDAVPGVAAHLEAAAAAGMHLAFVTNNAARPPRAVAEHLTALGVPAREEDVVTSAQAAARLLAAQLEPGSAVFVIGGPGLDEALAEQGLRAVSSSDDNPVAVVSGYYADLRWRTVSEGAILVKNGLPWVASNTDFAVPTAKGHGPGNGVLVEAVASFSGRTPVVAGKPLVPLFEETMLRVGGERPLVVGDRLNTDIEGANNAGLDSLLVLTGVTGVKELVAAPQEQRPTYISPTLEGLGRRHQVPERRGGAFELGGWRAVAEHGAVKIEGEGEPADWWRVLASAAWAHLDDTGQSVDVSGVEPPL
ncbi:MAG TPA: HAD-IIA family hydrolase [Nocardioidaceae bacterium]|nr:HAD-IIA family hydrolase [Nocardioidaceae bacterium]